MLLYNINIYLELNITLYFRTPAIRRFEILSETFSKSKGSTEVKLYSMKYGLYMENSVGNSVNTFGSDQ